jgi:putative ATPase
VYILKPLEEEQVVLLLRRALDDRGRGLGELQLDADNDALALIASYSSGDARTAYNALEVAASLVMGTSADQDAHPTLLPEAGEERRASNEERRITVETAREALQKRVLLYDKAGEEHFNLISALHKSVRNSDVDASLYWLGRMLHSGEDPLYIARRVVRMAAEDIGLADPNALRITLAARDAYDFLGTPEGELALAEAVAYLALAPKSNAIYEAYGAVQADVEQTAAQPVPLHLRNAPTGLMKHAGYAKGYQYAHDLEEKVADMQCLPDNLRDRRYYRPTMEGLERKLAERMEDIRKLKEQAGKKKPEK